jgi:glycosyltransferase involved in cell wall biosynthesis
MAGHTPIVSTPIPDVITLYGSVVRIADTPAAFVGAVAAALDEEGTARAARMAQEAALLGQYAWDQIAREMDALITDRVERKHAG